MRRVFLLLEPRTPIPHLTDKFLWHRFVQTQLIIHESKTCLHDGGCFLRSRGNRSYRIDESLSRAPSILNVVFIVSFSLISMVSILATTLALSSPLSKRTLAEAFDAPFVPTFKRTK